MTNIRFFTATFIFKNGEALDIQTFISPELCLFKNPDVIDVCSYVYQQVEDRVKQFAENFDVPTLDGWFVTDDQTGKIIFNCSDTTGYYADKNFNCFAS